MGIVNSILFTIFFPCVTSFIVTYLAIPKIIHFSNKSRLFVKSGLRNSHQGNIPIFGGIAIFSGLIFSLILWTNVASIQYILVSLIIVFFIGIIDDLLSLSPIKKLIGQIISILVLIFLADLSINSMHNIFNVTDLHRSISIIFTIFVVIVITNAYNLIDGIDGLAAGLGSISLLVFGILFIINKDTQYAIISFSMLGALFAFLKYNFNPAVIFMGDTGSLVLGLVLSVLSIHLINTGVEVPNDQLYINKGPFIAISLMAIPLYDTFRIFFIRIFNKKNPLRPDRNHIHHLLLDLGCSHKVAAIILYFTSTLIAIFSYLMIENSITLSIFVLSIVVLILMSIPFIILKLKKDK